MSTVVPCAHERAEWPRFSSPTRASAGRRRDEEGVHQAIQVDARRQRDAEAKREAEEQEFRVAGRIPVLVGDRDRNETKWTLPGAGEGFCDLDSGPEMVAVPAGSFMSINPAQANYDGYEVYAGGGGRGAYQRKGTVPARDFAANPWGPTFTETSGSGARTSGMTITMAPRPMLLPGCKVAMEAAVWSAAVPGSTFRGSSARPSAASTRPSPATTSWGFV